MMGVQFPATLPAILAGPVVSREDALSPSVVAGGFKQRLANCRGAPGPVGMSGADKVGVSGRYVSGSTHALANSGAMFSGQFATNEFRRNLGASLIGNEPTNAPFMAHGSFRELASGPRAFRGVTFGYVAICLPTGNRTELAVGAEPASECLTAAVTDCRALFPCHSPIISQKRVGCKPR